MMGEESSELDVSLYGAHVSASKPLVIELDRSLMLLRATPESGNSAKLFVKIKGEKFAIGTLSKEGKEYTKLNLPIYEEADEPSEFSVVGDGTVAIIGHYIPSDDYGDDFMDFDDDEEEDSEEDDEPLLPSKAKGAAQKGAPAKAGPGAKAAPPAQPKKPQQNNKPSPKQNQPNKPNQPKAAQAKKEEPKKEEPKKEEKTEDKAEVKEETKTEDKSEEKKTEAKPPAKQQPGKKQQGKQQQNKQQQQQKGKQAEVKKRCCSP
jgi:hypothetical protein